MGDLANRLLINPAVITVIGKPLDRYRHRT